MLAVSLDGDSVVPAAGADSKFAGIVHSGHLDGVVSFTGVDHRSGILTQHHVHAVVFRGADDCQICAFDSYPLLQGQVNARQKHIDAVNVDIAFDLRGGISDSVEFVRLIAFYGISFIIRLL